MSVGSQNNSSRHPSVSKISIQLQCPSQTFVSTRRNTMQKSVDDFDSSAILNSNLLTPSTFSNPQKTFISGIEGTSTATHEIHKNIETEAANNEKRKRSVEFKQTADLRWFSIMSPMDGTATFHQIAQNDCKSSEKERKQKEHSVDFTFHEENEQSKKSDQGTTRSSSDPAKSDFNLFNTIKKFTKNFHFKHKNFQMSKSSSFEENQEKRIQRLRNGYRSAVQRGKGMHSTTIDSTTSISNQTPSLKEAFCNSRIRRWAFWFIVLCLAALTVKDVVNLIVEYSGNPKKSDMNIRFNDSIAVPIITFCMSRAQAWSHFSLNISESTDEWDKKIQESLEKMQTRELFLQTPWDYRMVMETYNLVATITSMERETTEQGIVNSIYRLQTHEDLSEIRRLINFWINELKKRGATFEEFMQKVGAETLQRSILRFQRIIVGESATLEAQMRTTWISQKQICFQPVFDDDNYREIKDQGTFFIMVLQHNIENLKKTEVDCMGVDFHGRPSSSIRFRGAKGIIKEGYNGEHCLGMMHETTVDIKARYKMLENNEPGTACKNHGEGEDDEYDCYLRCQLMFITELCNCTAPTLSYLIPVAGVLCDYLQCDINAKKNYSEDKCIKQCLRDCDQFRFRVDHSVKGRSARPELTTILLNWGSFEYLILEQQLQYTMTSFIGTLGGAIGVWLGLSMLSIIQGTTYLCGYVSDTVKKKRRSSSTITSNVMSKDSTKSVSSNWRSALEKLETEKIATNPLVFPYKKMRKFSTDKF